MADVIIRSNAVFTGLEKHPFCGAIALTGDRITGVSEGDVPEDWITSETEIVDCGDGMIMPGFIDAHMHFYMGACAGSRFMNMEIEKSTSEEDCIRMMKEFEAKNPEYDRLLGWGWFPANWNDAPLPDKTLLDKEFPDKEVILYCADGHTTWLNSKGLEACGLNADTPLEFGQVQLDENGEPTGIVTEAASIIAFEKMYDFPLEIMRDIYSDVVHDFTAKGITMAGDMTMLKLNEDYYKIMDKLTVLADEGILNIKLNLYTALHEADGFEAELEMKERFSSGNIRYIGLKNLVDGVASTYTDLMLEPYSDNPDSVGDPPNFDKEYYLRNIPKANEKGLPVRLHCIGDRAIRWAFDGFEESNKYNDNPGNIKGIRNGIEHIESIHPDDLPRFRELGVVASMQPYHLTLDANEKISRVGPDRCRLEWPHRSILDSGAVLCFGTDYPVVSFDPFENIYVAITRKDDERKPTGTNPEQCITLAEALKCYTWGSAYSYGMEHEVGTLEPGKKADVIILDRNLFDISAEEIPETKVQRTYLNGELVYISD